MASLRKISISILSLSALGAVALGIHQAVHSNLFVFDSIEVQSSVNPAPYNDQSIIKLAGITLGKISLMDLDMKAIESRLMTQEWIKSVRLQKKMPSTLLISVVYREPQAVVQGVKGTLAYADSDGKVFGKVSLTAMNDLPFLSGFVRPAPFAPVLGPARAPGSALASASLTQDSEKIKEALRFISAWDQSHLHRISQISSIQWDSERGYRALVRYSLKERNLAESSNRNNQVRVIVELGHTMDKQLEGGIAQLYKVFQHLSGNSIAARQVWADAGKKIIVKTVHGS